MSYSLFIDFNKAFNLVPHGTLSTALEPANFSTSTISLIKTIILLPPRQPHNQRPHPACLPSNHGTPTGMSPVSCYSSPSTSTPSSTIFLPQCPPPLRTNGRTSHHAYIDDVVIKSEDVVDMQNSLNYFDGPVKVQANGTAAQKEFLTPRGSEFLTYNKKTRRPHTCYKYLGVYPFTHNQAKCLFHMLKTEIQS